MVVTQKLKELPCYVAILLLGIYPKDVKAGTLTYLYTHVHSIFTDRQFQCLSVDEWINKICYIHKMEYYSALRKKKLTHATTYMNLEDIMQSEMSQSQKDKYCVIPLT